MVFHGTSDDDVYRKLLHVARYWHTNSMKEMPNSKMSRRAFWTGAAALVATGAQANVESSPRPQPRPEDLLEPEAEKVVDWARVLELYEPFNEWLEKRIDHFSNELSHILDLGSEITVGDTAKRSRMEYLRTALRVEQFDAVAATELRRLLPAKAMAESGLNASLVSATGARGILQMMPGTWAEHARSANANVLSLREQVYATDSYLEQVRRTFELHAEAPLDTIREVFFAGQKEPFLKDFYVPLVINSFNAGAGTMLDVVRAFAAEFPSSIEKQEKLGENGVMPQGKDVYALMALVANEYDFSPNYGEQSSEYVRKVYAARAVLDNDLNEVERVLLLGQEDVETT